MNRETPGTDDAGTPTNHTDRGEQRLLVSTEHNEGNHPAMAEIPPPDALAPRYSHDEVDAIVANRAVIEQAKGILMFVYGIDGDHAFQLLRERSRTGRVKLRLLAEQFIDDVSALTDAERLDLRSACTNLLSTGPTRGHRAPEGS